MDEFENSTEFTSNCTPRMAGLLFLAITNLILAVPTAAANALVIVAILTTSSLQTPSYLLLTSLAFSDLAVGLVCQPGFAVLVFIRLFDQHTNIYLLDAVSSVSSVLSIVSVLTITAISVDRYLAIRLKMRYRTVVTVRRVKFFFIFSWIAAMFGLGFFVLLNNVFVYSIVGAVALTGSVLLIVVCYTMSFRALKIHCAQILPQGNQQPNSTTQSNAIVDVLKYRKLLKTMILIVVLILICYLPMLGALALSVLGTDDKTYFIWGLMSVVCLNSSLNPVVYFTRMKEIREAGIQKLRKLFRCNN